MRRYTAIYDACVLYPAAPRDLLMNLACCDLFSARWTEKILSEWTTNVLKKRPELDPARIARTRQHMIDAVPDCLIHDYGHLIDKLDLPDPDDRHVLAAAIIAKADVIVTFNLKHFPKDYLKIFEIEAQHPDDFVLCQIDLHIGKVLQAIKAHRASLRNPPKDVEQYLSDLKASQFAGTANRLEEFSDLI